MQTTSQTILGIDPGTLVMGYGLVSINGNKLTLLEMGVLQLDKHKDHARRLELIYKKMETLIKTHQPTAVAIEAPFYGKNVQSMLKLGRAQGVAIAAAMINGLEAVEYAPKKIKQSVTGNGNATKEQVWKMLQHILDFEEDVRFTDATDALAVALCHHFQARAPKALTTGVKKPGAKKAGSWEAFLTMNPNRVR